MFVEEMIQCKMTALLLIDGGKTGFPKNGIGPGEALRIPAKPTGYDSKAGGIVGFSQFL